MLPSWISPFIAVFLLHLCDAADTPSLSTFESGRQTFQIQSLDGSNRNESRENLGLPGTTILLGSRTPDLASSSPLNTPTTSNPNNNPKPVEDNISRDSPGTTPGFTPSIGSAAPVDKKTLSDQERLDLFLIFAKKFGRLYELRQFSKRFEIFNNNLDFILENNHNDNSSYQMGVNHFADFSWQEFLDYVSPVNAIENTSQFLSTQDEKNGGGFNENEKKDLDSKDSKKDKNYSRKKQKRHYRGLIEVFDADTSKDSTPSHAEALEEEKSPPKAIDWMKKGFVFSTKNQGTCASSAAFAATTAIESRWGIQNGVDAMQTLSSQGVLDCTRKNKIRERERAKEYEKWSQTVDGDVDDFGPEAHHRCQTSSMKEVWEGIMDYNGKLSSAYDYPYKNKLGKCKIDTQVAMAKIEGFVDLEDSSTREALLALQGGPITGGIPICDRGIQFYHSGVFQYNESTAKICSHTPITHYLAIIGYGVNNRGIPYFDCINSWGGGWGTNGRVAFRRPAVSWDDRKKNGQLEQKDEKLNDFNSIIRPDSYPVVSNIMSVVLEELTDRVRHGQEIFIESFSGDSSPKL